MGTGLHGTASMFCIFFSNKRPFAVAVEWVKEVHVPSRLTPIPGAPPAVVGYVNLRGLLYLVVDPLTTLTGDSQRRQPISSFVVFRESVGDCLALAVDQVVGMVPICTDRIDVRKSNDSNTGRPESPHDRVIAGFAKLESETFTIINPQALFEVCLKFDHE